MSSFAPITLDTLIAGSVEAVVVITNPETHTAITKIKHNIFLDTFINYSSPLCKLYFLFDYLIYFAY